MIDNDHEICLKHFLLLLFDFDCIKNVHIMYLTMFVKTTSNANGIISWLI